MTIRLHEFCISTPALWSIEVFIEMYRKCPRRALISKGPPGPPSAFRNIPKGMTHLARICTTLQPSSANHVLCDVTRVDGPANLMVDDGDVCTVQVIGEIHCKENTLVREEAFEWQSKLLQLTHLLSDDCLHLIRGP